MTCPPSTASSSFIRASVVSEDNPLLDFAWKLNILEKEAVCSLGIVYGELNQDRTAAEFGSSEEVVVHVGF